jgi:hypothetical protein
MPWYLVHYRVALQGMHQLVPAALQGMLLLAAAGTLANASGQLVLCISPDALRSIIGNGGLYKAHLLCTAWRSRRLIIIMLPIKP